MSRISDNPVWRSLRHGVFAAAVLLTASHGFAQQSTNTTVAWKATLQDLGQRLSNLAPNDATAVASWRAEADGVRAALADFARSHPQIALALPEPLPEHPSATVLQQDLQQLTQAVDEVIRHSPDSPFHLGSVTINVSAKAATPSLVSDSIDRATIQQRALPNVAQAANELPGVEIEHIAARNEAGIRVRGFTTRGQVPFYLDGVPISVPYDGYVDFNRFLTSDIAELQITKGYSSPLLGPNALGGTINMVTIEPVRKLEGEAVVGAGSGDTLLSTLRIGSRWQHFLVQGTGDWMRQNFTPLSGALPINQYVNLPDITMSDRLNNSRTLDKRLSGSVGWMPGGKDGKDEYVFSTTTQKGQKGVPLYQGPNTAAAFKRFWSWPYWDMNSYQFHSNTGIGDKSSIGFRAFYNQFKNAIDMFSNDTYVMTTPSAERSAYDEHTDGASVQFLTQLVPRNDLGGSFFFKDDTHRENGIYPDLSPAPFITPELLDRDQQLSIGLQDEIELTPRLRATLGFSSAHFDGLQGEFYNPAMTGFLPFVCTASPNNTSVAGCTLHAWNNNPEASLSYQVIPSGNLFLTFADEGRFPMLKDIYSAGLGSALPNPDLKPERSRNWNLGYSQAWGAATLFRFELFRSDLTDAIESVAVTDPGNPDALNPVPAGALCPTSTTGFCSQNVNVGQEVHEGVEATVTSTLFSRLNLNGSYSYLNRTINYDFSADPNVNQVHTSIMILPTLPRNKLVGTASLRLPRNILAMLSARYEGGLLLQDTTYAATTLPGMPFAESFATADIGAEIPLTAGVTAQTGVKNLFDRNYAFTAGYPEEGRNWFLNLRYRF